MNSGASTCRCSRGNEVNSCTVDEKLQKIVPLLLSICIVSEPYKKGAGKGPGSNDMVMH